MVKNKTFFIKYHKLILTLCLVFASFCWAAEPASQYDNLSYGVPGKADTIINRPGYALGYIEYHEQPAWVIYIMTREEAITKAVKRTDRFRGVYCYSPDRHCPVKTNFFHFHFFHL